MTFRMSLIVHAMLGLMLLCAAVALLGGCTEVKGGSSAQAKSASTITGATEFHEGKDYEVVFPGPYGPITIRYGDKANASTQPTTQNSFESSSDEDASVKTNGNATPRISQDGTLSFDRIKPPPKEQWPLFVLFGLAAVACWKFGGNIPGALMCAALALLSVVWPAGLIWLSVLAIAIALFSVRKTILQLIRGNQNSLEKSSPDLAERLTSQWAKKHDESTQRVVKSVVG